MWFIILSKKDYVMRIITVNQTTGVIESVVQLRKEKVQEHLFTIHILVVNGGRISLYSITFFREVEVVIAEEITPIMGFLDGLAKYRLT